jgi:hypothetical protein
LARRALAWLLARKRLNKEAAVDLVVDSTSEILGQWVMARQTIPMHFDRR